MKNNWAALHIAEIIARAILLYASIGFYVSKNASNIKDYSNSNFRDKSEPNPYDIGFYSVENW